MPAATLKTMAQRACIRNISRLQDVGEIEYDFVRTILKKVENPEQLRNIEIASPQIGDHDAELWRAFIARDIPDWEEKIMEPKNPRSWWKVYRKLIRQEHDAKAESERQLQATLMGIDKHKEANKAQIVQKVIPQQSRGKAFAYGVRNKDVNAWGQTRTPALQNAKTGKRIMSAIRKQSANAYQQRGRASVQPASALLPGIKSQITRAPEGMIRDHAKPLPTAAMRQQAQARGEPNRAGPRPTVFANRATPSAQDRALNSALRAEQAKREERLRAIAGGSSKATPAASPPPSQPRPTASTTAAPAQSVPVQSLSPARPASPQRQHVGFGNADTRRRLSPSPAPQARKRPATPVSIFMPAKKRKV